jgi:multicomponent Na+:H+ antiporter subunit E
VVRARRRRVVVTDLLAIVTDRGRVRDVVTYALREARDATDPTTPTVRFLVPVGRGGDTVPRAKGGLLAARIDELVAETGLDGIDVETVVVLVESDGVGTRVSALVESIPPSVTDVLVMPAFREFTADGIATALADAGRTDVAVERAPVGRRVRRPPVAVARTTSRLVVTFGIAFAFYLSLGDPTSAFDLGTGVVSAAVVTLVLGRVAFESVPTLASVGRVLRALVFLPYLLAAIVRANLSMAAVVLDPRLPIDPSIVRVPAPEGRVARALLANSITLTPGTLTVDVTDDELVVHALTDATRESLEAGALARAVDFVVHGRASDRNVDESARDATGGDAA